MIDLCFVVFLVCFYVCVCECTRQSIFIGPRSITGVPFDSARRFRTSLLLHLHLCVSAVLGALTVWIQLPPPQKKEYVEILLF